MMTGQQQQQQHRRTAHNMSSSSLLRKRSETSQQAKAGSLWLRGLPANLHEVFLGTKLFPLFAAVPLAVAAHSLSLGHAWVFALSLIGLAPLAERVSFLSEQIAEYAGPTVGGLLNATCGNAPELIIALLALHNGKLEVLKWSLLGSILSNLLLVLGSSLVFGGFANLGNERPFDRRQSDVCLSLLLLGALCHVMALIFRFITNTSEYKGSSITVLKLSRPCSIVMLLAYAGCLFFQLKTHHQFFEAREDESDEDDDIVSSAPVIGFTSAIVWLLGMTAVIAILSDYVVSTIEAASESWGLPVSFISVILLPIVGNAAEHAGAIIFAAKNKIDITLGVALGSSTQISMFVIPLTLVVAWIKGVPMDLNFGFFETASLVMAILITAFVLQDGNWHYMKGFILFLCYIVVAICFFILKTSPIVCHFSLSDMGVKDPNTSETS
uniref:Vacuolar cation/proton exchanger n=1 Tax=Ananas comosus var. bracteatus TaxID=296719 RepID=A0A6V7QHC1_ANACO|nr:unnamed protein product [Ananas comosus var. bracteatus]